MNNVSLIGNITKDIELRASETGTQITSFSVAVRRDNEHTDFINCKAFNKTAELLSKYTNKGSKIGLTGRIQTGSYQNKGGKTIYTTDVIANQIYLLGSKQTEPEQTGFDDFDPNNEVLDDSSLPF